MGSITKEGKWPWAEQHQLFPAKLPNGESWPLISVVMASYNHEKFIETSIRSVLLQGYPNIEYIIIDDGSTDSTLNVISKYQKHIFLFAQKNQGQSAALNSGFKRAKGDFIVWQDSDDFYPPGHFKTAIEFLYQNPQVDIVYGNVNYINENDEIIGNYPVSAFNPEKLIPYPNMCHQAMVFKRKIFENGFYLNESYAHVMDMEFYLRLYLSGHIFKYNSELTGFWRIHPDAKSATQNNVCRQESLRIYENIYRSTQFHHSIRRKSISCIQWICLAYFSDNQLRCFKEKVLYFSRLIGISFLSPQICIRFIVALLGRRGVGMCKFLKKRYKAYFARNISSNYSKTTAH